MGMKFSEDELRVLRECDVESLMQRSIPLGTAFGVATWMAAQKGYIKTASGPKIFGAIIVGYFLGKLSYQQKCAEKIMRLPNSQLAEMLRRRKKGEFFESFTPDGGLSLAPFSSATDVYTDENMRAQKQQNSLDLDVDRPANFGLDDTYRPSLDQPESNFNDNLPLEPPKSSVSYEELRRRNREEHDKRMQQPFSSRPVIPRDDAPVVNRAHPERDESQQSGVRNRYGDVWK
jgi:Ovarian carcinoma immunoreactive antigen (OCIA)